MLPRLMLLRHQSLPCPRFPFHPYISPKLLAEATSISPVSTSSASVTATAATTAATGREIVISTSTTSSISYGPTLQKGVLPFQTAYRLNHHQNSISRLNQDEETLFNEDEFTRIYEISGLRVPSEQCYALESRLRGHLLNWPRIRNVARVRGDDVDEETQKLLTIRKNLNDESDTMKVFDRRIYGRAEGGGEELSPVLYRDKLVREFNSRGFVRFRNLAKISRPKRKKKKRAEESEDRGEGRGRDRRVSVVVGVVGETKYEDDGGNVEEEDLSGLLGYEFKGRKWRGSTRLLLLDERYAGKEVDELPEAIKAVIREEITEATLPTVELVRCRLTLFYDYWQMNEVLEALLPKEMIVPSAFESVGHIAHLNLREEHLPYKKLIAKVVLDKNKPKIQSVVNKIDAISGDYRTMQLEVLAGNHSLVTMVVENGLRFHVDLATVWCDMLGYACLRNVDPGYFCELYWNSRLATERQRLISCFTRDDVVCDVFSGVGPIAIAAAKKVKHVYANDLNPYAVDYLERNCVFNKLERKIKIFNMDGRRFIDAIFRSEKAHSITQVVMNLPNDAADYLDAFRGIFIDRPNDKKFPLPKIHVYGFSKAEDPEFDFHERIRIGLKEVHVAVDMNRVRLVAPGKWMLCASFILPEIVAYGKTV